MTSTIAPTPRLRAGYHLYPAGDGTWRCRTADGALAKVHAPGAVLTAAQSLLYELPTPGHEPGVTQLLDLFSRQDWLEPAKVPGAASRTRSSARVAVTGTHPVAAALVELLTGVATVEYLGEKEHLAFSRSGGEPDLLVSCVGWLPDTRWRALDRTLRRHPIPWHHSHFEGDRIFLGPFWLPQRTASYRDLRARRLAACGAPDELKDWWRSLETPPAPPLPTLSRPGARLTAALLAADVLAWLDGRSPPSENHEVEVDVTNGRWWRHPVLLLPQVGLLDDE
ncbi:MAG: hypothetical protein M3460_16840 [Actinomycetota bacterium]|nr:hypothetical protein [Actinomycetota bacterium]